MKTRTQTDAWICYIAIVLGFILVSSIAGILLQTLMKHSISEVLVTGGMVAGAGLAKLFISPLNLWLYE